MWIKRNLIIRKESELCQRKINKIIYNELMPTGDI